MTLSHYGRCVVPIFGWRMIHYVNEIGYEAMLESIAYQLGIAALHPSVRIGSVGVCGAL